VSYEPIHHKYRPQTFADLVGQDAISTTLSNAIRLTRIAPAYLFTGPRGTGKTSSARILSKSLNCLSSPVPTAQPCGVCDVCQAIARGGALDVIEIDAASNTGVDNIRELIERAQFAPVQCRYKIYCLDEVHMLSTAAFNALLKTLEEPPDRVVFILATTDPQRVLPTIISRCQRFDFRRIPLQAMIQHLAMIARTEQIEIAPDAIEVVAQLSQGGLRDAESLLDQLSLLAGEITVERVWDLVGSVPEQDLLTLSQAIASANPEVILERTRYLLDRGREPLIVLQNLTGFYRDLLIAKTAPHRRDLVAVTESTWIQLVDFAQTLEMGTVLACQQHLRTCEIQVKNTTQPRLWLEVCLLGLIQAASASASSMPMALTPSIGSPPLAPNVPPSLPTPSVSIPSFPAPVPSTSIPSAPPSPNLQPQLATVSSSAAPSTAAPVAASTSIASSISTDADEIPWPSDPFDPAAYVEVPVAVPVAVPGLPEPASEPSVIADYISSPVPVESSIPVPAETSLPITVESAVTLDLAQIWQQLLGHLNRPSQALLSEHGQLISFKGREAQIGIRNGSLARIAQSKLPDVESAFLKVFNRKVGVSLQIMTTAAPAQQSSIVPQLPAHQQTAPPPRPQQAIPSAIASSPAPVRETFAPSQPIPLQSEPFQSEPLQSASFQSGPPQAATFTAPLSAPPQHPPAVPSSPASAAHVSLNSAPVPPWEAYDELTHSARNFAQFFNGALVNLEGDDPLGDSLSAAAVLSVEAVETAEWEDVEEK
jgi:DNA polymerase III subunit gamma/tau